MIRNERQLLDLLCATTRNDAHRIVYRNTTCGAAIRFERGGIVLSSIVEGCDFGTASYPLRYPFTEAEYRGRITAIEHEAAALWDWANVRIDRTGRPNVNGKTAEERGVDVPDVSREYAEFEQGDSV